MTLHENNDSGLRRRIGGTTRPEALICRVSLLAPQGRRTHWWYLACCPECRQPHHGRSRDLEAVAETRRLSCGHWVTVVIARVYGNAGAETAA